MTEQAIEIMARGIDPQAWADELPVPTRAHTIAFHMGRAKSIAQAQAALTALEAAGMVVVSVVPTEAMRAAGADKLFGSASDDWGDDAALVYAAMLAASPLPTPPIQAGSAHDQPRS
jgi:hypothetical protein